MAKPAPGAKAAPADAASAAGRASQQQMDRISPAPAAPALAALIGELDARPPALWLERIIALRREGRREDADALLAEFKRRYPEEPLPATLQ